MIGKCPERGTILVKDGFVLEKLELDPNYDIQIRCPSCTKKWHRSTQLEWENVQ